jgi:Tfp pilus assembly protein PilF
MPTAAHFIYIPGVLLLGVVIGWILGSRAAADAYASELRKRGPKSPIAHAKSPESTPNRDP